MLWGLWVQVSYPWQSASSQAPDQSSLSRFSGTGHGIGTVPGHGTRTVPGYGYGTRMAGVGGGGSGDSVYAKGAVIYHPKEWITL